jgi:NAD(P)-dependent dehydrogenase (short-subunit alcohol dehydrogenase family)
MADGGTRAMTGTAEYLSALFGLSGDVALVTGGGGGLGRAFSLGLAAAGAAVVVADVQGRAATAVAEEVRAAGGRALAVTMDVGAADSVEAAVALAARQFSRIDILVNNAGINVRKGTEEMSREDWDRVMRVNIDGVFNCSQVVGRRMIAQGGGRIINIASIMGFVGCPLYPAPAYHASKGAVVNFTRALAVEWAKHNIRVNGMAPTYIRTELTGPLLAPENYGRIIEDLTPMGKIGEPDDLVGGLIYLASRASALVTGHTLVIDAGWLAR